MMIRLFIFTLISISFGQVNSYMTPLANNKYYYNNKFNYLPKNLIYLQKKREDSLCGKNRRTQKIIHEYSKDNNASYQKTYYKDSIIILHSEHHLPIYKDKKSFDLLINNPRTIAINFSYNQDSLVEIMFVYKPKPHQHQFEVDKAYYSNFYNTPSSLKELELNIEEYGHLRIEFREKFFMKRILYFCRKDEKDKDSGIYTHISFYEHNEPKEYGIYTPGIGRTGTWYTYHKNGIVSSEGIYNGNEFDDYMNEFNLKKDGSWFYYTEKGCLEKEEQWDNGKLIKTTR